MPPFYETFLRPLLFRLEPETAHDAGAAITRTLLSDRRAREFALKRFGTVYDPPLERFGLKFANPVGLAAGFDKNCTMTDQLAALGFGFVEVGTVTLRPQSGNKRPRLFRLPKDNAFINRLGFNNDGADLVAERLSELDRKCIVGVNIGKNKDVPNEEAVENYLGAFNAVQPFADYVAVNISSPNTPGLRDLQQARHLDELLSALQARNAEIGAKPLLVKIAPDLTDDDVRELVDVCLVNKVAGVIATNTTTFREGLRTPDPGRFGAGGLSGRPLTIRSNQIIASIFRHSGGKLRIIGVGGIFTPNDAYEKIRCGASLIQAYTGFIYGGPRFAKRVNQGLSEILEEKGFEKLDDAVGTGLMI